MKKLLLIFSVFIGYTSANAQLPTVISARSQPLKIKVQDNSKLLPTIAWQSPNQEQIAIHQANYTVAACIQSTDQLKDFSIILNGKELGRQRGMKRTTCGEQVSQDILLQPGINTVQIKATNSAGVVTSALRSITYQITNEMAVGQKRLALIIANSSYEKYPLKNPINDGRSVKEQLEKLGFAVTLKENLPLRETDKTLEKFYTDLGKNNVGLFYYAGHGMMADAQNLIQPVDADPSTEVDAKYVCYSLNRVVDRMKEANPSGSNVVFWDACRNNPYRSWNRSAGQAVYTTTNPPVGTLIIYATEPGKPANDGNEKNGLFTSELVKNINEPNLDIFELVNKIDQGLEQKGFKQPPYIEGRLRGKLILNPH